jgi:hypothetical protein
MLNGDDRRDTAVAGATIAQRSADGSDERLPTARTLYGRLTAKGLDPAEAGNLTAFLNGLAPVSGGWDVDEIERLLFVCHLVDRGRLRS